MQCVCVAYEIQNPFTFCPKAAQRPSLNLMRLRGAAAATITTTAATRLKLERICLVNSNLNMHDPKGVRKVDKRNKPARMLMMLMLSRGRS